MMTRFDAALRRGLMDANLAQYEKVLQQADAREPDFSPSYLRERTRLLADPWGWMRRRELAAPLRGRRVNWRLAALIAALLLLSACAYAVATGQFSQWFPRLGTNPQAPETSEEVLTRTGTVIGQSQTVGDTTATLNAAVWDSTQIYLSFTIESPSLPEDLQAYTPLHTGDCRLILRQDQWEEYETNQVKESCANQNMTPEETEEAVRAALEEGDRKDVVWLFCPETREGNVLSFQVSTTLFSRWFTETRQPELTLHLENIAVYEDGKGESITDENGYAQNPGPGETVIPGPFDLTFTLEGPILPIHYEGADAKVTAMDIPLRFTGFEFSALELTAFFDDPMEPLRPRPGETLTPEKESELERVMRDGFFASSESVQGLWTEDGTYVDLSNSESSGGGGNVSRRYPYPIDPATVTAVDIAGTRVELGSLERVE